MGKHRLLPHPGAPAASIEAVEVEVVRTGAEAVLLRFSVTGGELALPARCAPERADDLWQTTCFELFLRPPGSPAYFEFNFSPSSRWAAYAFESHRHGRRDLRLRVAPVVDPDPDGEGGSGAAAYALEAEVDLSDLPPAALRMGLSAIVEETDGTRSYWALAHPPGDKPDFHDPSSFVLELPAYHPPPSPRT